VLAERVPFWLGGLRKSDWSSIRLETWQPRTQWDHPEIAAAMARLGDVIRDYATVESLLRGSDGSDIILASGSLDFITKVLPWLGKMGDTPVLMFVEGVGQRQVLPEGEDLFWRKISHQWVGGGTTQVGLFGFIRLKEWAMEAKVGRGIGHIVNFGARPKPAVNGDPDFKHYKLGDRLRRKELGMHVVFATHWCGSGFGHKKLDAKELSSAFDLPLWMQPTGETAGADWLANGAFEKMNPLMLFNAVLDPALVLIGGDLSRGPIVKVAMPEALAEDLGVDLPLIGKYLVHSWVDNALVTKKAGKSDDAGVPTHLWDQRIAQVLDVPVPVIDTMRKWLFKRYCRGLMRSLSAFLRTCHGKDWALQLVALRQERRRMSGSADAPLKRLRGGESFFDLERNAYAGSDVVRQDSSASWWEWNGGSALIFWRWGSLTSMINVRDGTKVFVSGELPRFR
jgi:hypothetical protein